MQCGRGRVIQLMYCGSITSITINRPHNHNSIVTPAASPNYLLNIRQHEDRHNIHSGACSHNQSNLD